MKIGGYYESDNILSRHWERQCKEVGYAYPALRETLHRQARTILEAVHDERNRLVEADVLHPIIDEMIVFFEKHIGRMLDRFKSAS